MENKYVDSTLDFDYIAFLEEKGLSVDLIRKIQERVCKLSDENAEKFLGNLKSIYPLLKHARLSESDIETFLSKNIGVLTASAKDIIATCAVLNFINVNGLFDTEYAKNIHNYERLFMRYILLLKNGNKEMSPLNLLASWKEATKKSTVLDTALYNVSGKVVYVNTDKDLKDLFDIIEGRQDYIDRMITSLSHNFFKSYIETLAKDKTKNEKGM